MSPWRSRAPAEDGGTHQALRTATMETHSHPQACLPQRHIPWAVSTCVALLVLAAGWAHFWFLCDDAFVAFRYVDQAIRGRGLVWNPAPFVPVEGYSSFLWVAILWLIQAATGVEPPTASTWVSLGCSSLTLLVLARNLARAELPTSLERVRLPLTLLCLMAVSTNRTVLAWSSSGLETALWVLLLTSWVLSAAKAARDRPARWLLVVSALAALLTLTRPEGGLAVLATLALAVLDRGQRGVAWSHQLRDLLPLVAVPAHLGWRLMTYGSWLPNTFVAKNEEGWIEAGLRYLVVFLVEYGYCLWVPLVGLALWRSRATLDRDQGARLIAFGVLAVHLATYVVLIGGDHFEYRVLTHLAVLAPSLALWTAARVSPRPLLCVGALALMLVVTLPLPWLTWSNERDQPEHEVMLGYVAPLNELLPEWASPLGYWWKGQQEWLQERSIAVRVGSHDAFLQGLSSSTVSRSTGEALAWGDRPVVATTSIGWIGWVYPNAAVLDFHGLVDRVVARTPRKFGMRMMAHNRWPPPGYVECFRPNLNPATGLVRKREPPLLDEDIEQCEAKFFAATQAKPAG